MTTLTEDVVRYQETGEGYKGIVDRISVIAYNFPARRAGFSEEDCAEFLLRFYPRIPRLVGRFRPAGFPFESYLQSTLKWQIKSYAASEGNRKVHLYASRAEDIAGAMHPGLCHEREDPYVTHLDASETEAKRPIVSAPARPDPAAESKNLGFDALKTCLARRLIMMALKASEHLDEGAYRRLASSLGCDSEWLVGRWQQVRESCIDQRNRRDRYREMRDKAWFRSRCLQLRRRSSTDPDEWKHIDEQIECVRHRYNRARRLLARMPTGPTHQQIATALGIPKGTVDSGIHYAKRVMDERTLAAVVAHMANTP